MTEIWAIVELFGHNKIAGKVSEETIAGQSFVRVDVPALHDIPAYTKFLHGNAIYAITPMDEDAVKEYAAHIREQPLVLFSTRQLVLSKISATEYALLKERFENAPRGNNEIVELDF